MKVEIKRVRDGKRFLYDHDPEVDPPLPGFGKRFELEGEVYRRPIPRLGVIANHRRNGYFSSIQLPCKEQVENLGLPAAPHYDADNNAAFTTHEQAREYARQLNDSSEGSGGSYEYDGL